MGRKARKKRESRQEEARFKLLLAAAIIQLVTALLNLVAKIVEK